ncbi:chemotaxis protein MotB [Rhodovulum bhavnagarense]|uniref:Chemotaxis protein MotB n=1 Tax=Rhodovulum bhavnagarense TaxID=992286 RepID=A0A4R2RG92_9RHOB|nr:OmpA family protein [Rhodovulum bhavnagarense]TCP61399.1 chemotaxis protein MotB [Rhodovulum bhavnagarense]
MAKTPIPLPVPDPTIEQEPEEERKCPDPGAPAWMATFADIATLLMAFFVLILSFADFNQPKFKQIAGSLRNSFGVQRDVPVLEQPLGTTSLELTFSPSPTISITEQLRQQTTEVERQQIETRERDGETDSQDIAQLAQELTEAMMDALQSGAVTPEQVENAITLRVDAGLETGRESAPEQDATDPAEASEPDEADALREKLAQAIKTAREAPLPSAQSGKEGADPAATRPTDPGTEAREAGKIADSGGLLSGERAARRNAQMTELQLRIALREEIDKGLVTVENVKDKVRVTVGAGGAFESGSADLTVEAQDILGRVAYANLDKASRIEVTGHTDDRPLGAGAVFGDNWGLAAARASAVVRVIEASGAVGSDRLRAVSMGQSQPVAENTTPEGRAENRRIEIEIEYPK